MVADSAVHREKIAEKLIKSKDGLKCRGGKRWPRVTSARGTANKTRGKHNHSEAIIVFAKTPTDMNARAGLSSVHWTVNSGDEELIFTGLFCRAMLSDWDSEDVKEVLAVDFILCVI